RIRNATARADAATISARDLCDADLPRPIKSVALFSSGCGMPNGSHGLPPSQPQSLCNFALAGDAYSVSSRTVRPPQVAPWLSAGPSSEPVAYAPPDAQAALPPIPTVVVLAMAHAAPSRRCLVRDAGVTRAIGKAFGARVAAEPDIRAEVADRPAAVLFAQLKQRA
ncbi:MAG: hypothetical protein V7604_2953, partial [Hyphomicrobiales bacterium]